MKDTTRMSSFIAALYGSAADGNWEKCLEVGTDLFSCRFAQLLHARNTFDVVFDAVHDVRGEQGPDPEYYEYLREDPRDPMNVNEPWHPEVPPGTTADLVSQWKGGVPITDRMVVSEADLHRSRLYTELLRPFGVETFLAVSIFESPTTRTGFGLMRGPEAPLFNESERARLARLVPHIRLAVSVNRRFEQLDLERNRALRAIDKLELAVFLVGANAVVAFANRAAHELLAKGGVAGVHDGRLHLGDCETSRQLRDVVNAVLEDDRADAHRPLRATGASGNYSAMAFRLRSGSTASPPSPIALGVVLVVDPERPLETEPQWLERLYGLSRREGEVLHALVNGATLEEAAASLAVKLPTVKLHLRNLLRKTGTIGQADLVRVVLRAITGL